MVIADLPIATAVSGPVVLVEPADDFVAVSTDLVPLESEAIEDELPSVELVSVFEVIAGKMAGVVGVVESFFAGCAAIIGFGRAGIAGFVFNEGASCGEMADCEPVPLLMGAIPREVAACGAAMVAGIA